MSVVCCVVTPCDYNFVCRLAFFYYMAVVKPAYHIWLGGEGFGVGGAVSIRIQHHHGAVAIASGDVYAFAYSVVVLVLVSDRGV